MSENNKSGRAWVWGLTLVIVAFVAFFVGLAIWAFQSDVELVYENYYEKDVVFEQQIRRVERTEALLVKPDIKYYRLEEKIDLVFPSQLGHQTPSGELLLFRPSDLNLDRSFPLELGGDTLQTISVPQLEKGLWRARLSWSHGGLEYYMEEPFMVQ